MADGTKIEWTDATWNPVRGCARVSEGCRNCYAETVAARFCGDGQPYAGLARYVTRPDGSREARWTGEATFGHNLDQPLTWRRPRRIFVNSMSDLFYERFRPTEIATVYGVMIAAHHLRGHTFQVLTKGPARMRELLRDPDFWEQVNVEADMHVMERTNPLARRSDDARATLDDYGPDNPPPGIWLGVSVEDQPAADERIPILLDTPAALRWISAEPLLGPIDLTYLDDGDRDGTHLHFDALTGLANDGHDSITGVIGQPDPRLDWVVAGGESSANARPMHPDWARSLRDQCAAAGVPFLFKQWGEWGAPSDDLGKLDWPYHRDYDRTHWFDARFCCRPIEANWSDKYKDGAGAWPPPPFDMFKTPEYLDQVGRCHQEECRTAARCQGNAGRTAVTRVGKKAAGRLLDGIEHNAFPSTGAGG